MINLKCDYEISVRIFDNYEPIDLSVEDCTSMFGMPIIRENWKELSEKYALYFLECEHNERRNRNGRIYP